jgi:hypothetical protein
VAAAAATLNWEIAAAAIDNIGNGDHGDLMVFVSDHI